MTKLEMEKKIEELNSKLSDKESELYNIKSENQYLTIREELNQQKIETLTQENSNLKSTIDKNNQAGTALMIFVIVFVILGMGNWIYLDYIKKKKIMK